MLYDLLKQTPRDQNVEEIRENNSGDIVMQGVTEKRVVSLLETMQCLEQVRTTAAVNLCFWLNLSCNASP